MQIFDPGFAAHIAGQTTSLCTCWKLVRTDGVTLGFTDHDAALVFDGVTFDPRSGFEGSEVPRRLGLEIDTVEVLGVLDSAAIATADIRLGRFDRAVVETWRVNWANLVERALLRTDTIGEITEADGGFRAELRSATAILSNVHGRVFQRSCDALLGDGRCQFDVNAAANWRLATAVSSDARHLLRVTGLEDWSDDWASSGQIDWQTGQRSGLVDIVERHFIQAGAIYLSIGTEVLQTVTPGDTGRVTVGCDKKFSTCGAK
ncbi:MAG: DUF2163 domain-containing protein [Alphaproteobacteria bacterium]|nr:DUF2163 domain-containing protein [Alphaproteobacteria bacterium]